MWPVSPTSQAPAGDLHHHSPHARDHEDPAERQHDNACPLGVRLAKPRLELLLELGSQVGRQGLQRGPGAGARPRLEAPPPDLRAEFEEEFKARLRRAYPERAGAVVPPFRRVFVVARVGSESLAED